MREKTCCFTGHRKLEMPENELKDKTRDIVITAINDGYTHFVCGGALGFDTLAAECILKLKKKFANIVLEIAIPCENQDKYWTKKQKKRYAKIVKCADITTLVSQTYTKYCMQKRNEYMADKSSLVIAYFNGLAGGTKNAVDYATRKEIDVWFLK